MRAIYLTPALAASCLIGLTAAPRAAHAQLACGSGYHADANGSCQSDSGEVSRYCPAGQVYHPWINGGWICETPGPATSGVAVYSDPAPAPRKRAVTRSISRVAEEEPATPRIVRPEPQRQVPRVAKPARRVQQARSVPAAEDAPAVAQNPAPTLPPPIHNIGGGGGGGGGGWSDRRLKRDVVRLGNSPSGLPIYAFQYVWGGPRYIGVMAQDLLKLRPDAVILDEESGYYKVDYSRIDVEMREERHAA